MIRAVSAGADEAKILRVVLLGDLSYIDQSTIDRSTEEWLGRIEAKLCYGYWFCGHWHVDKRIDKMHFLMYSYETLPELKEYTFNVDENVLNEMLAWCGENGTTLDLVIRAFLRFAIDPKNRETLHRWVQEQKIADPTAVPQ